MAFVHLQRAATLSATCPCGKQPREKAALIRPPFVLGCTFGEAAPTGATAVSVSRNQEEDGLRP